VPNADYERVMAEFDRLRGDLENLIASGLTYSAGNFSALRRILDGTYERTRNTLPPIGSSGADR
jgi:hypothetical protein